MGNEALKENSIRVLFYGPKWIRKKRPLEDEDKNFEAARISGRGFLTLVGKIDFFKSECHLSVGLSLDLANLAEEIVGRNTAMKQGKFIPYSKH